MAIYIDFSMFVILCIGAVALMIAGISWRRGVLFLAGGLVILFMLVVYSGYSTSEVISASASEVTSVEITNIYDEQDFSGDVNLGDDAEGLAEIRAEFIDEPSALVGENISCLTFDVKVTGSPTGLLTAGVFSVTGSTLKEFGSVDVSEIGTTYETRKFCLTSPDFIILQNGHRVGVKFAGGDSSNDVQLKGSGDDLFDDTSTRHQYFYLGDWGNESGDLTMTMESQQQVTTTTDEFEAFTVDHDFPVEIRAVFAIMVGVLQFLVLSRTGLA